MRSNLMTLPQLLRFGRTSLVRLYIRNYRLVVLLMIKICTMFVCYDCIGYFSRFAYTLMHIACFHESVNIQMVLQILWFSLLPLSQLYQSDRTSLLMIIDQTQNCLQNHLYQTVDLFACYTLFIKFIGSHFILIMFYLADDVFSYRFFANYQLCNRLIT